MFALCCVQSEAMSGENKVSNKYMMEWELRTGFIPRAFEKFLQTNAPIEGVTFQRFHAPGSTNGWIIIENLPNNDLAPLYIHAATWSEFLSFKVTPVFSDEQAGGHAAVLFPHLVPKAPASE